MIFNNTGILFFAKNLENIYRHTTITCALFKGTDKVNILDRKDFNADLVSSVDNTMLFLKQHIPVRYEFDNFVTAVFERKIVENNVPGSGTLNGTLTSRLSSLLENIEKNPGIQANTIADNLNRPIDTTKKQIRALTKKELIERRGSRKTGGYFLKDK